MPAKAVGNLCRRLHWHTTHLSRSLPQCPALTFGVEPLDASSVHAAVLLHGQVDGGVAVETGSYRKKEGGGEKTVIFDGKSLSGNEAYLSEAAAVSKHTEARSTGPSSCWTEMTTTLFFFLHLFFFTFRPLRLALTFWACLQPLPSHFHRSPGGHDLRLVLLLQCT